MQRHLLQMAKQAALAVELQQKASQSVATADEFAAQATADQAEAAELQAQSDELLGKAKADQASSQSDQVAAEELEAQSAAEEASATTEFSAAAAEEVVVEEDTAKATADATAAARNGFEAEEDELLVGACNAVPVLDVVCNVVGGVAAVGLETATAREAARAAAEYAAAVAAQVDEESLVAEATEVQAAAARDSDGAVDRQAAAAELKLQSEQELVEGQAEQVEANEKLAESTGEKEAAEEQEAEAVTEEEGAAAAMQTSLAHGAMACWDGILAGLVSLVALGFFAVRLIGSFVLPALACTYSTVAMMISRSTTTTTTMGSGSIAASISFPTRTVSHVFHHVLILVLTLGAFGEWLATLDQLSLRSRGGILLEMAASAAFLQSAFLHFLPHTLFRKKGRRWHEQALLGGLVLLRSFVWLWPLFLLEVLLLRVNFGSRVFTRAIALHQWYLWALFAVTLLLLHYVFVERRQIETIISPQTAGEDLEHATITTAENKTTAAGDTVESIDESTALLGNGATGGSTAMTADTSPESETMKERTFWQLLCCDLQRLVFPFELLIATSMFALLRQSITSLERVWPVSKAVVAIMHPHWHLALLGTAAACILALVVCIHVSRHYTGTAPT